MATSSRGQGLEKRKACDLCHIKKIRCDAKKPKCSHCIVYGKECVFTPHIQKQLRRSEGSKAAKAAAKSSSSTDQTAGEDVQLSNRLSQLEATVVSYGSPWPEVTTVQSEQYPLPPPSVMLPIIEDFFRNFNSMMPLFDESRFMRRLAEWTINPSARDAPTWAAINAVLALSIRSLATKKTLNDGRGCAVEACIQNAQSVMSTLVLHDSDLRGLQVILTLAILFQGTPQPGAASVLVATAVKLAHRLRLHTRRARCPYDPDPDPSAERTNVFWITYTLDRDINSRHQEPYLQHDDNINVDEPAPLSSSYSEGSADWIPWTYFSARVRLARIQGLTYDFLHSVQADSVPDAVYRANRTHLTSLLRHWLAAMPSQLLPSPDELRQQAPPHALRHLVSLYLTYFFVLQVAQGLYTRDVEWAKSMMSHRQWAVMAASARHRQSVMVEDWPAVAACSRCCMRLWRLVAADDWTLIWSASCAYLTSLVVIIANSAAPACLDGPVEGDRQEDELLIAEGLAFLERIAEFTGNGVIGALLDNYRQLKARADVASRQPVCDGAALAQVPPWQFLFPGQGGCFLKS